MFIAVCLLLFSAKALIAQTTIKGRIVDNAYQEPLIGANVVLEGSTEGTIAGLDGSFNLKINELKDQQLVVSFVGYEPKTVTIEGSGNTIDAGVIILKSNAIGIKEINIIADRARERETPVAFSNIERKEIEDQLGSRDIPMILNVTPSVYATAQGGGAGDARINVRGFDQKNVAIMINGVPVNDMENGWVYWSNWDGIADATSSIQLQRGLSAVNLATPSIGGTMNIITSPAGHHAGGSAKFEYGSGNFIKTTVSANSGLINDKFALSANVVRKVGDGVIDKTWTDAWAYYAGVTFIANDNHRFEIFALGAPQRHGQNLYKQNVAAYSHDYAREIGADPSTLERFPEASSGKLYNENWNTVSSIYAGKQFWNGKELNRYDKDFINERENYYHKPLINANWYAKWSDKATQYTTFYYSGGKGGGSGTLGSMEWDYSGPSRIVDWDATIEENSATDTAYGILRNSVNEQWTIGALSRVKVDLTEKIRASVGIDWRMAEIDHFQEVRDLLGGQIFVRNDNEFDSPAEYNKVPGDKIGYNFTNTVDWIGYFAQAEYSNNIITLYGTFGNSFIKYSYTNHFVREETNPDSELSSESDWLPGFQLKGGLSYRPMEGFSVFVNYGYISKAPIFDNVINDQSAVVTEDPKNEIFSAFEIGSNYIAPSRKFDIKVNYYYTKWSDRANLKRFTRQDGSEGFVFLRGMDQLHQGLELEGSYQPIRLVRLGVFASFAKWVHTNNVSGTVKDYDSETGSEIQQEFNYYVKDLRVGDAPQTQAGAMLTFLPVTDLRIGVDYRYNANHYALWDPFSRDDETDNGQVWKMPAYSLVDLHVSYKMDFSKVGVEIFAHVFNLFDEIYIQDAVDNSPYNGNYESSDEVFNHDVNTAEVYLGLPLTYNVGLRVSF
jgi:hypothetical protein